MCHLSSDRDDNFKLWEAIKRGESCKNCKEYDDKYAKIRLKWEFCGLCFEHGKIINQDSWCDKWTPKKKEITK